MSSMVPDDAPKPRLCHLKKRADFSGYGFNLHAEKGKAGQFIGKIDPGSPSEHAYLKEGDRIVEVNGTNIGNENHQQVVQRVKAVPDETKLLVVDDETDKYYKEKKIVVRGDMPNVLVHVSDGSSPTENETTPVTNGVTDERPESTSSSQELAADAPHPRNCHIKLWPDFQGYGFNLHAEKGKPGQYIGNVDEGGPAECAGLREGDRIIEVNGENISRDNHAEVVKKIKSDPKQTVMLVLDPEAEKYYKEKGITVSSKQAHVDYIVCPDSKPQANGSEVHAEVNHVSQTEQENSSDHEDEVVVEDNTDNTSEKSEPLVNNEHVEEVVENDYPVEDYGEEEEEDKAETVAEYANVVKTPPVSEPEPESPEPSVEKVSGASDGEEAAEAISESIREMEQAVAEDEPPQESETKEEEIEEKKPDEKLELNNNADIAEDYDVIANVPKTEEPRAPTPEPEPERAPTPEPERAPTPEPVKEPEPVKKPEPVSPPAKQPVTVGGITFAGSAKEARERMSKKRRDEVKQQQLSSKDKYNLYMKM